MTTNGAATDRPPTVPHSLTTTRWLTAGTDRVDRTDQASTPSDPLTKLHELVTHALQLIEAVLDQEPTP